MTNVEIVARPGVNLEAIAGWKNKIITPDVYDPPEGFVLREYRRYFAYPAAPPSTTYQGWSLSTPQQFVVPIGGNEVVFDVVGAMGGTRASWIFNDGGEIAYNDYGGFGGRVTGKLNVFPEEILDILVGGIGGANNDFSNGYTVQLPYGAGRGYNDRYSGGGGGDPSEIRRGSTRLVVAGGGGGSGRHASGTQYNGGHGGGRTGGNAPSGDATGGTQTSGGTAGTGGNATDGGDGYGGDGSSLNLFNGGSGGGGGGWFGGGGGGAGGLHGFGGAGGSSSAPGASDIIHEQGWRRGPGYVKVTTNGYRPEFEDIIQIWEDYPDQGTEVFINELVTDQRKIPITFFPNAPIRVINPLRYQRELSLPDKFNAMIPLYPTLYPTATKQIASPFSTGAPETINAWGGFWDHGTDQLEFEFKFATSTANWTNGVETSIGIILRYVDEDNYIWAGFRKEASQTPYARIMTRVNGVNTQQNILVFSTNGSWGVRLQGNLVSVINGNNDSTIISAECPVLVNETKHGFMVEPWSVGTIQRIGFSELHIKGS